MTGRTFHCKNCNLDFGHDVGEIQFEGLLPSMKRSAVCPSCGREISSSDILYEHMMATQHVSTQVMTAVDRLARARSWDERRTVLEGNPVLLTEEAEDLLKSEYHVIRSMGIGNDEKAAEQLFWLVRRCREVGIARAFHELR